MTYAQFQAAWREAVLQFLSGEITEDELMEFGSLDEFMEVINNAGYD